MYSLNTYCTLLILLDTTSGAKDPIKIGLFIPGDVGEFEESKGLIPMGEVAQDQINNSTKFLPDYNIEAAWFNTKAESGKAIHQLFSFIGTDIKREYVGIVGPVFTDVAKYISELAPFFNYVSVSPTASSSSLSEVDNRTWETDMSGVQNYIYRNSLRLHPMEPDIYKAIFKLASTNYCDWKKIHILTGEGGESEFSKSVIQVFLKESQKEHQFTVYQYSFTSSNTDTLRSAFEELKKNNARIIIANFNEDDAYDVFCTAKGMDFLSESEKYNGRRVWVLTSSYSNDWITRAASKRSNCSKNDVIKAVGTYLTPHFTWNTTINGKLDTGYTFNETWQLYAEKFYLNYRNSCGCSLEEKAGSLMYDAVWTLAMGLDRLLYRFDRSTRRVNLSRSNNATERAYLLGELLLRNGTRSSDLIDAMRAIDFEGASGNIAFKNANDKTCRSGFLVKIQQLQIIYSPNGSNDLDFKLVDVCKDRDMLDCDLETLWNSSIFKDKDIHPAPKSNSSEAYQHRCPVHEPHLDEVDKVIIGIPMITLTFFTISSLLGTLLSTSFFIFNIVFMKERVIKMSSPHLNNIILLGSVLLYSYVPISGLMTGVDGYSISDEKYLIKMCSFQVKYWILCVGFTTSFGALFAKTWRVYAIFTSKKPRHLILSDWKLVVLILILLLVDIVLLGINEVINRYKWDFISSNSTVNMNPLEDKPEIPGLLVCVISDNQTEITGLVTAAFVYKGLLLLFGAFIAFQTRNISIPALNDSKYIGISIYTTVVVVTLCWPVSMFVNSQPAVQFGIVSTCITFPNTIMICLVFLPKAYQLRYQPKESIQNQVVRDWDSVANCRKDSEIQVKHLKDELEKRNSVIQVLRETALNTKKNSNSQSDVDSMLAQLKDSRELTSDGSAHV